MSIRTSRTGVSKWAAPARAAALSLALAGLALSIPGDPGGAVLTGTSENSLLHENSRTPAVTSIQMLVPKRVRLIIGFTQTVLA